MAKTSVFRGVFQKVEGIDKFARRVVAVKFVMIFMKCYILRTFHGTSCGRGGGAKTRVCVPK